MKTRAMFVWLLLVPSLALAEDLKLNKGDHICLMGNTLAERMQYFGGLESRLTSRFADHDLVFRKPAG